MKKSTIYIMVILLIMPLISCVTTKKTESVYIPELIFPIFPDLSNFEYKRTENGVIVSNEYILELSRYKILIEETEKTYNDIKSLYEED